jgi:hypothetical protein
VTRPEIDDWNVHSDPPGSLPEELDDLRSCNDALDAAFEDALDDWHARAEVGYLECTCRGCEGFGIDLGRCWPCEEAGCSGEDCERGTT